MLAPGLRATMLSVPLNTPFPLTLGLAVAAVAACGAALALFTVRAHPRPRVYVLLAGGLACGLLLAACAGYFLLAAPSAAEPIMHIVQGRESPEPVRNPYYALYQGGWVANVGIALLLLVLVLVIGMRLLLRRARGDAHVVHTRRS
jgi:hypothetical protein